MARRAWAAAGHAAQITDHSKLATAQAFCTQLENGVLEPASRPDPRELLHRCDTKRHMLGGTGLHTWRFMMGALAQGINRHIYCKVRNRGIPAVAVVEVCGHAVNRRIFTSALGRESHKEHGYTYSRTARPGCPVYLVAHGATTRPQSPWQIVQEHSLENSPNSPELFYIQQPVMRDAACGRCEVRATHLHTRKWPRARRGRHRGPVAAQPRHGR